MKTLSILLYDDSGIINLLLILVIAVGVFFLLREVMLWYWKINASLKELKEINANIKLMLLNQTLDNSNKHQPIEMDSNGKWIPVK